MIDYCIIGSGISGATVANLLSKKFSVRVFDKANGIGGRSSFKRFKGNIGFDHGLQYLSPHSIKFKKFTKALVKKKILKVWKGYHKFLNKEVKEKKKHLKLIGRYGNNQISKYLLKNIKCHFKYNLLSIKKIKNEWYLKFTNNKVIVAKNLIITAPFPQSKKLISKFVKTKLFKNNIIMNSSITLLLITNKTKNIISSFFTNDEILSWISYENSKKRFSYNKDLWVLQSSFDFGKKHSIQLKNKKKYYINFFINKFKSLTKINIKKISYSHIHGWKYSSNSKSLKVKSYWDRNIGLGICADWFGGPRLENGWLSANDLYTKIIKNV